MNYLKILLIYLVLIGLLISFSISKEAKALLNGIYTENNKFSNIKDIVIDYEFRGQEDKKLKSLKEEDIPLIGQGKIFYKYPYLLRIETEFLFHPSLQGTKLITIKNGINVVIFKEDFIKPLSVKPDNRYPLLVNFPFLYLLKYEEMDNILYPVVVAYEDIGSGELKGTHVAVISIIDKTKIYERYRIYLDTKTYFPVKTIFFPFEKDKDGIEVIYKEFSYVADGRVWPKKVLIYYFNLDKKTKYLSQVIYLNNISINVGLTNDIFETRIEDIEQLPSLPYK